MFSINSICDKLYKLFNLNYKYTQKKEDIIYLSFEDFIGENKIPTF